MEYEVFPNTSTDEKVIETIALVHSTINIFRSIEIDFLNNKLNESRCHKIKIWELQKDEKMIKEGLGNMTYADGLKEIQEPFILKPPEKLSIIIFINEESKVNGGGAAMEARVPHDPRVANGHQIRVYLDCFDKALAWGGMNFREIFFHELLHVYGDINNDGVIRHNIIGVQTIIDILSKKVNNL